MKAQVLHKYGIKESFSLEQIAKPEVKKNEVLVQVAASGINPADFLAKELGTALDFVPPLPGILGMDMSGKVVQVGSEVADFKIGDEVYGCVGGVLTNQGTLAEYVSVDAKLLARKPVSLRTRDAAAVPLVAITAWEGIMDVAHVEAGQKVIVFGAGGAVGSMAVQLAKYCGAFVVAVENERNFSIAQNSGADVVVNAASLTLTDLLSKYTSNMGFDVAFDAIGGAHLPVAFEATKRKGIVLSTIGLANVDLTLMHVKSLTLHVIYMLIPLMYGEGRGRHGYILSEIAKLVDAGKIKTFVDDKRFNLTEANEAYSYASTKQNKGKVLIDILC